MKTALAFFSVLFASVLSLSAADDPAYTYQGEISGVVCSACSKKVKASLTKIEGVKSVKITPSGDTGVAKLEIVCTKPDLTKETAAKALGASAEFYPIKSLKKE